jgi:hypothetical protein
MKIQLTLSLNLALHKMKTNKRNLLIVRQKNKITLILIIG